MKRFYQFLKEGSKKNLIEDSDSGNGKEAKDKHLKTFRMEQLLIEY